MIIISSKILDVKGSKKKQWSEKDKNYQANAAPIRNPFMGAVERGTPAANNKQTANKNAAAPSKKLFGLF